MVPRLLLLTDSRLAASRWRTVEETVKLAIDGGARWFLLRERELGADARKRLASSLAELVARAHGSLVVAGDAILAREVGAAGVHLATADASVSPDGLIVGRSCHNSDEVRAAADEGVDYVTVSPVFPTVSKPGYGPALGAGGLARVTAIEGIPPVLALGGVTPRNALGCISARAHGVAVMGAVMGAKDPRRVVRAFLRAAGI